MSKINLIIANIRRTKTYLFDIYASIVVKNIITRFGIKDLDLFNRIYS